MRELGVFGTSVFRWRFVISRLIASAQNDGRIEIEKTIIIAIDPLYLFSVVHYI